MLCCKFQSKSIRRCCASSVDHRWFRGGGGGCGGGVGGGGRQGYGTGSTIAKLYESGNKKNKTEQKIAASLIFFSSKKGFFLCSFNNLMARHCLTAFFDLNDNQHSCSVPVFIRI